MRGVGEWTALAAYLRRLALEETEKGGGGGEAVVVVSGGLRW